MDDLINQWTNLQDEIKRLTVQQEEIAAKLLENMSVGEEISSSTGNKVRKCARNVLDPDALKEIVSSAMWTRITERKPVAALYKAEIQRGRLAKEDIENASKPSRPWLEKR